ERAGLIAHDWEAAEAFLDAARWSRRAAEWVRASSISEAYSHWQQVHALAARTAETEETARLALDACVQRLELGWRVGISADDADAAFKHGEALAMQLGNPRAMTQLLSAYPGGRSHLASPDEFWQPSTLPLRP